MCLNGPSSLLREDFWVIPELVQLRTLKVFTTVWLNIHFFRDVTLGCLCKELLTLPNSIVWNPPYHTKIAVRNNLDFKFINVYSQRTTKFNAKVHHHHHHHHHHVPEGLGVFPVP